MKPTDEQLAALDLFRTGDSMVIGAGAGTGKTSTLRLLAYSTPQRGAYLAFNKSIVVETADRMPRRCSASTAHSLAFRAVGRRFAHRLGSPRMRSNLIATALGLGPFVVKYGEQSKVLQPGYLAGLTMRGVTRFCQSIDEKPSERHVPYVDGIDIPDDDGRRTFANNAELRKVLAPAMVKAWADVTREAGQLPYKHDHYLKLWQLSRPRIEVDYILFDEAQDADPVMAAIVAAQTHAQRVYVGDENQAIYEWRGAVNAMDGFASEHQRMLTQSFRFGEAIAEAANEILDLLESELRLRGLPSIESEVGELGEKPYDAMLCRTNARAVSEMLHNQREGRVPHLIGSGTEVAAFARGAKELKDEKWTSHPDLTCFRSWGEVLDYVRHDPQGDELKLLTDLVEEFGVATILRALDPMPSEAEADVVISTAHKAKGREWPVVILGEDFAGREASDAELRLRYVACTRARNHLDKSALDRKSNEDHEAGEDAGGRGEDESAHVPDVQ